MVCLDNIVGIIETPTTDLPNVTTSLSGLWLEDTTAGRIPVKAAFYNDNSRIGDIIKDAVKEALGGAIKAANRRLAASYTEVHSTIGFSRDWTGYITAGQTYYYLWIDPKDVKGSIWRIKEINIYTENGLHTGQIDIYKGETVVYSGLQSAFTEMTIDLDETIYVAYAGDRPRDFKYGACCGRTPTHHGYVSVGSGTVAALSGLPKRIDDLPISDYCNGIEVRGTFDCDAFSFLCGTDFVRSEMGILFAKLVQQIARKNIGFWLLTNNKVTTYAVCKEEKINQLLEYLVNDIEEMLNYIPEIYDHSDCYICNGLHAGEIRV